MWSRLLSWCNGPPAEYRLTTPPSSQRDARARSIRRLICCRCQFRRNSTWLLTTKSKGWAVVLGGRARYERDKQLKDISHGASSDSHCTWGGTRMQIEPKTKGQTVRTGRRVAPPSERATSHVRVAVSRYIGGVAHGVSDIAARRKSWIVENGYKNLTNETRTVFRE